MGSALLAVLAWGLVLPGSAIAQVERTPVRGLVSLAYSHSFQDSSLDAGSFDDGNGFDFMAGFQPGEYFAFSVGYQLQVESDYVTHFIPASVRGYSPVLLERWRLYGEFGTGPLWSRLSGKFNNPDDENERAWAWKLGGGVEVDIDKGWGAVLNVNYTRGFAGADDYKYTVLGLGVIYRWDI